MNKFQKEGQEIFKNATLSDERKQRVIETVHSKTNRKSAWLPAVVVMCALGIGSFLLFAPSDEHKVQEELYSASTLEPLIEQEFRDYSYETLKIIEPFTKDNTALVVNKVLWESNNEWLYEFLYAEKTNGTWKKEERFAYYFYENQSALLDLAGQKYLYGILNDSNVDTVFVGDKEVSLYELDNGKKLWFAKAKSNQTPVYYEIKGKLTRQGQLGMMNNQIGIPFIEGITNEKSFYNTRDTMHRGNNDYSEFPVLYDPYYYAENRYTAGDVVVIATDNGLEVTRIIDTDENKLAIEESTIILRDDFISNEFYLTANYDGDSSVYSKEITEFPVTKRDEVFVHPDNWGSDGFKGPIAKTAIKGYVLGYDLNGVTNTMKQDELNMFRVVQKDVQEMKTSEYAEHELKRFLKGASAQDIAIIYYYAAYLQDYETMYAMYAQQDEETPMYEQWHQLQKTQTQTMLQHNLVKLYYTQHSTLNEKENQLELYNDEARNLLFKLPMIQEDGVWKVRYTTVSDNRN